MALNKTAKKLMVKLQKLDENPLTREAIIPMLQKLGYFKVEFNGGPKEEGKDIICWDRDRLKNIFLNVAQVKHFKFNRTAASSKSLNGVVNQLSQCFSKSVTYIDKKHYFPDKAYLISTFELDNITLKTRFGDFPILADKKIEIIDGLELAKLMLEHVPEIASKYLGEELTFDKIAAKDFNNLEVLKALGFQEQVHLKEIYTDVDFSLGKKSTQLFFSGEYKPRKHKIKINYDQFYYLKDIVYAAENEFGQEFIIPNWNEIELRLNTLLENLDKWKVSKIKKEEFFKKNKEKFDKLLITHQSQSHERDSLNDKKKSTKNDSKAMARLAELNKLLFKLDVAEKEFVKTKQDLENHIKTKPEVLCEIEINGNLLFYKIKEHKISIESKVKQINKNSKTEKNIVGFLSECHLIFQSGNLLLENDLIKSSLFEDSIPRIRSNYESTRLKLPLDVIFNSGLNITLLGEAGAGKTTALQIYAYQNKENNHKLVIWAPLPKVLKNWSQNKPEIIDDIKIKTFANALFQYLIFNNVTITEERLIDILNKKKVVILFDSIDEAIRYNSWLPDAITELSMRFNENLQLIVTSRLSGDYIDKLPFFTITLMPFTRTQRNSFIKKWFGNESSQEVNFILKHLKENKQIDEITRTPLLTTALCVLAKNKLSLPQTEIKLFNDRLKLLTGYYDSVKQIQARINTSPQDLELLSKKIAYYLHSRGKREESIDKLKDTSVKILENVMDKSRAIAALEELIDPCNVLVPMNDKGEYGFGHLRFQEHLTAIELNTNRSIDVSRYINQSWWTDTLILFAQMSDSIKWMISLMSHHVLTHKSDSILFEMIAIRPVKEQEEISQLISKFKDDFEYFEKNMLNTT